MATRCASARRSSTSAPACSATARSPPHYTRGQHHPNGQHIQISMLDAAVCLHGELHSGSEDAQSPDSATWQRAFADRPLWFLSLRGRVLHHRRRVRPAIVAQPVPQHRPRGLDRRPRFHNNTARLANKKTLDDLIGEIIATRSREEWLDHFESVDVPAHPLLELHEALRTEQAVAQGVTVPISTASGDIFHVAKNPMASASWDAIEYRMPPVLGADGPAVLERVGGLSPGEISSLLASGVLQRPNSRARTGSGSRPIRSMPLPIACMESRMRIIDHVIAGGSVGFAGRTGAVFDPNVGQVQAQVRFGTPADLDRAVAAAQAAQPGWAATNPQRRARVIVQLQGAGRGAYRRAGAPALVGARQGDRGFEGRHPARARGDRVRVRHPACAQGRIYPGRRAGDRRLFDAPAAGDRRGDHPVQLPGDDPLVDVGGGDRVRQRVHPQAQRA